MLGYPKSQPQKPHTSLGGRTNSSQILSMNIRSTEAGAAASLQFRALHPQDGPLYHSLRLRALQEQPEAFGASYAEERALSPAQTATRLSPGPGQCTLGAFVDGQLVGMATLRRPPQEKLRHQAKITAMYVAPEHRKLGLARALLEHLLSIAASWGVLDVVLVVTAGNGPARELYTRMGFRPYGLQPRALLHGGQLYDVELMLLPLVPPPTPGAAG
jgi:ribosomal protein S18 acetylase RimI-like enzyme